MALIGVNSAHITGNNCILEELNNMFNKPDQLQFANCTIETEQLNLSEGENKYITEAFRKQKINIYDRNCPISVDHMLSVLSKIGISIVGNMPNTIDLVNAHEQYIRFTLKSNQYTIKL